jgi:hypothetical protein
MVFVVNLRLGERGRTKKGFCNKAADAEAAALLSSPNATQMDDEVTVGVDGLRYDVTSMHAVSVARAVFFIANAPDTRNREHVLPSDHGLPNVDHGQPLLPFEFGVKEVVPWL